MEKFNLKTEQEPGSKDISEEFLSMDSFDKINGTEINTGKQGMVGAVLAYLLLALTIYYFI